MSTISLCMIVKDEEKVIERCLNTIVDIVDEIIIVDTGSQDSTKEKVKKYKADIYDFPGKMILQKLEILLLVRRGWIIYYG